MMICVELGFASFGALPNLRDYDPDTGRFLNRNFNPDSTNPYVPWKSDPAFGRWVEGTPPGPHQIWSLVYEQALGNFKLNNPNASRTEVFSFLNQLLSSGRFPSH
ncbi:MAG: hypothetical protein JW704_02070 [Anaerolineaceae bacterium]|nr:hypothetical protein [Anaerolineaceae bacterium]